MTESQLEARGRAACAWYDAMRPYFDSLVLLLDESEGDELRAVALRHLDQADRATIARRTGRKKSSTPALLRRGYREVGYTIAYGPWDMQMIPHTGHVE